MDTSTPNSFEPFRRVDTWIFDLDDTLCSPDHKLLVQIGGRINTFIGDFLGVDPEEAQRIRLDYRVRYGTALGGLMAVHKLVPDEYLEYVHDIDFTAVKEAPALNTALGRLPGRKFIFTSSPRRYAERVTERLGLRHHFDGLFDTASCNHIPKYHAESYEMFLQAHGVEPKSAVMFEDTQRNLEVPHAMGMLTVLVQPPAPGHSAPVGDAGNRPPHIHHVTDDLAGFLETVATGDRTA